MITTSSLSFVLEVGRFYRLKIKGRGVDVPRAEYLGRFHFDWVPAYRGREPVLGLERDWFTYVDGAKVMLSVPPDDILESKDVT